MTWSEKVELVKCLNQSRYEEAVRIVISHKDDIDYSDIEMFILGFNLSHFKLLIPLKDLIEKFSEEQRSMLVQLRLRLALVKMEKCQ